MIPDPRMRHTFNFQNGLIPHTLLFINQTDPSVPSAGRQRGHLIHHTGTAQPARVLREANGLNRIMQCSPRFT